MRIFRTLMIATAMTISIGVAAQTPIIQATGPTDVCFNCVPLTVTNPVGGYTYAWFVGNYSCINPQSTNYGSGTSIQACATGEFYCVGTDPNGLQSVSNPVSVRVLPGSLGSLLLPKPYGTDPVSCLETVPLCIPQSFYSGLPGTISWYLNNAVIPGAVNGTFNATTTGYYKYSIATSCVTAFSDSVFVLIPDALPTITANLSPPVCTNDTVTFSVSNPQPNSFYTWERQNGAGVFIFMANGSSTTYITQNTATNTLIVRVKVNDGACIRYTPAFTLQLQINNPNITPNGNVNACAGTGVLLTATSGSTLPGYTFQWLKNGNPVNGATQATYQANQTGNYAVAITAQCGTNYSAAVNVTVNTLPVIGIQVSGPTTFCNRDSVIISSNVSGNAPFLYQWRKYGNNIIGAFGSSYTAAKTGNYTLRVTDVNGCAKTSINTPVTVNPLPVATIVAGGPVAFCAGGSVLLTANTGTGLSYQWRRYTTNLPGANTNTYTATTAGKYRCVITNQYECIRTSNTIEVFVPCREGAPETYSSKGFSASVYPNPSSGSFHFTVMAQQEGTASIRVFDITGRLTEAEVVPIGEGEFELNGLQPGVYVAEIIMGDQRELLRLVKTE